MKNEDKIIFAIMVIIVAFGLFKKINNSPSIDIDSIKNEAVLSIDNAEKGVIKTEEADDEVKCECGGTGFITHGDGHRTPCPAGDQCESKKKKTSEIFGTMSQEKNGTISFYTLPGCAPCLKWKNEIKPWVEAAGWKVEEIKSTEAAPWFEVWIKNKSYVFKGFMSKDSFREIVKNAK